ncbi:MULTISPECIES: hypothetical protein [unclassified Moorena]|uniref:hypothetical protein n=2 Tax=Coleofasciculaceae TaxID=1892251 RepID=UPI001417E329|nr:MULTISPECIES: hypothetical protein [unclassified Moorena]NEO11860.1 hypothetical protein [Moorena sp. SIO3E8]
MKKLVMAMPGESFPNINNALVALGEALRSEFQALIGEYTAGGLAGNYLTSEDCSEIRCLEEVVSQVGQLGEEFTALETWLTSGFIPKGLATPNPTMEDSWSTPVRRDQVSKGNNSEVFVTSGDVLSRVESGATRRQKAEGTGQKVPPAQELAHTDGEFKPPLPILPTETLNRRQKAEGRGQKVPTTTPAQELTLDEELFRSSSFAPSTQPISKKPTLGRNEEVVLPKHSSNVQGLKELAELLPSQEQLDLANPNLVSASDPTLYSNLVDPEDLEDNGDQVLFTNATPDQLIDDYGSGEEISGASPETLQRFPLGADIDIASPQALQTSSDPSAISHQLSAISHQPSAISHQPSAISHQPSAISHQPSAITHYPLPITHQPLPITDYPLPITHSSDPSKLETEVETDMISRNGTPEMDLDEIMDAIARKVSREYRRFYGSS